ATVHILIILFFSFLFFFFFGNAGFRTGASNSKLCLEGCQSVKNWEERTDPALADSWESLSVTSTVDEHLPPGGGGVGDLTAAPSAGPSRVLQRPGLKGVGLGRPFPAKRSPGGRDLPAGEKGWFASPGGALPGAASPAGACPRAHLPLGRWGGRPRAGPEYINAERRRARRAAGWWTACTAPAPWGWRPKGSRTSTRTERRRACGSSTSGTPAAARPSTRPGYSGCCGSTAASGCST
uniref:Uncharacterized protein n=1 Tax=Mustela putorius furo TaxID=9669 RepID=M3Y2T3_MUSPF